MTLKVPDNLSELDFKNLKRLADEASGPEVQYYLSADSGVILYQEIAPGKYDFSKLTSFLNYVIQAKGIVMPRRGGRNEVRL